MQCLLKALQGLIFPHFEDAGAYAAAAGDNLRLIAAAPPKNI
jgi:hypothetical protein